MKGHFAAGHFFAGAGWRDTALPHGFVIDLAAGIVKAGDAQRQEPLQGADHRRLHFGPGRRRDKPFDNILPLADDTRRLARGIVFDQPAFGIGRIARNARQFQRQGIAGGRMRARAHQQDRIVRRGCVQIGTGQIALFGQCRFLPAIAGDPFARPQFGGLFAHHVLNFDDRMRDQRIDIAWPDRDRVEVRVDKPRHQRTTMQVDHPRSAIPVQQVLGAGRHHPAVAHGNRRSH